MNSERLTHRFRRLAFFVALAGLACKGPQGDVGPQGPAGPVGTTGATGPQGAPGTANVLASPWVTANAADWRSDNDPQYFYVGFEEKNLTQALLDKGTVVAYYRDSNRKNVVLSLPSTTDKLSVGYFLRFADAKGTVNFDLTYSRPRLVPIDFDLEFRWVLIPANAGGRQEAVDWTNYEEVRRALNLAD